MQILPLPRRPAWVGKRSNRQILKQEDRAFEEYLSNAYQRYPPTRLNHFEHNVLVWKELWRCSEMSNILLLCTDARFPLFHFPPSLYDFVVKEMKKPFILVRSTNSFVQHAYVVEQQTSFGLQVAFNRLNLCILIVSHLCVNNPPGDQQGRLGPSGSPASLGTTLLSTIPAASRASNLFR